MSESDSGSSHVDDAIGDGPLFPLENKFYSKEDKKYVMSLSEVEREAILAERAQAQDRQIQDEHLRRLLLSRERDAKASEKKRKAADTEDSPRKSSRQKTTIGGRKVGEASDAIEAYKRQRERDRIDQQRRRDEGAVRKERRARSSSSHRYSSADAEGEDDVEWDDGKRKGEEERRRNAPPADYNNFRRVTLPRSLFSEFCFYPGFGEAVKDCYVRMPRQESRNDQRLYQLLMIKGNFLSFCTLESCS